MCQIHLLGVKLVELILGAPSSVLLLLNLQMGYLWLLHHVLQQHLLVKMACNICLVSHVDLFGTSAACLIETVAV